MTTTQKFTLKEIEHRERMRLPQLAQGAESSASASIWISIIAVMLPFLSLFAYEIGARIVDPPLETLSVPWRVLGSPYPPLSEYKWTGDLTRMARLPYFDQLVKNGPNPPRIIHRLTDEWGFVNRPAGKPRRPIDEDHQIIACGTSYMAEGSTVEKTFASQLGQAMNQSVYNACWPSAGPVQSVLKVLTDENFCTGKEKQIVMTVIQRYLYSGLFEDAFQYLEEDGTILQRMPTDPKANPTFTNWMNWRKTIENYLERTSAARLWAWRTGWRLPPMAFDLGLTTPVQAAWLQENNAPILFYSGDIDSAYHNYETRNGDRIAAAVERIAKGCAKQGIRFLLVIVPDKYEIYRDHAQPILYPNRLVPPSQRPPRPARRAPEVLTERLREKGVDVIDLFPPLYHAQFDVKENNLLYWVNDTHWNDRGIQIAAQFTAEHLRSTKKEK